MKSLGTLLLIFSVLSICLDSGADGPVCASLLRGDVTLEKLPDGLYLNFKGPKILNQRLRIGPNKLTPYEVVNVKNSSTDAILVLNRGGYQDLNAAEVFVVLRKTQSMIAHVTNMPSAIDAITLINNKILVINTAQFVGNALRNSLVVYDLGASTQSPSLTLPGYKVASTDSKANLGDRQMAISKEGLALLLSSGDDPNIHPQKLSLLNLTGRTDYQINPFVITAIMAHTTSPNQALTRLTTSRSYRNDDGRLLYADAGDLDQVVPMNIVNPHLSMQPLSSNGEQVLNFDITVSSEGVVHIYLGREGPQHSLIVPNFRIDDVRPMRDLRSDGKAGFHFTPPKLNSNP